MFARGSMMVHVMNSRQLRGYSLQYLLISMAIVAWSICWYYGPFILAAASLFLLVAFAFMIRIDIAFYTLIVLWMTLIAAPLPIASPFTPGETADLPFYEIFTPLVGLCLLTRIAMQKARVSKSPLNIPMLVWFGLVGLTYFRNPVFLQDLFGMAGTGAIYHTIYPLFLCAIFYLSAASILKTEKRIILSAKIVFAVMITGMALMIFMLITGWNIPLISGGRAPWAIRNYSDRGRAVVRIMAMSSYSAMLFLSLLCFGRHLRKSLQVSISLLLVVTLVLGGGRTPLVMLSIFLLLSFIVQPGTKWLIVSMAYFIIIFALMILPNISLPYTARRVITVSSEGGMGVGGRVSMAQTSWNVMKSRPLVGYGYGQLWRYFPDAAITKQVAGGDPHSGFMAVMTHHGLIGLGVFVWLMLTAIKTAWWLYRNIEEGFLKQLTLWITMHLSALLVVFFISAQIDRSIFAYLEMGIIASIHAIYQEGEGNVFRNF